MSLAESQRLLARLYTDAELRRRFFAAPEDVGVEWGLAAEEARALVSSREQVDRFAHALEKKHLREVRRLLPHTAALLAGELGELYSAYSASDRARSPPGGFRKILEDALRFAAVVERRTSDDLVRAVACYEAAWVRAGAPGFRFAARIFPYRMGEVLRRLDEGEEIQRAKRPSLHLWWRLGRLRHLGVPG